MTNMMTSTTLAPLVTTAPSTVGIVCPIVTIWLRKIDCIFDWSFPYQNSILLLIRLLTMLLCRLLDVDKQMYEISTF